jgi:G6PDH family F420-dependent oxidoreductase
MANPRYGYSLMCELHDPNSLRAQAKRAEEAGFDFLTISDHYHPWLYSHGQSPYAWSVLGALAAETERVDLISLVTCPTIRYHPAVVAQKAATVALMSGGRFQLGLGAGENLNEHVVGKAWPPAHVRHEMLEEAIEIMKLLWSGGYHSYAGKHFTVYDARLYTLPETPPPIHVAASGRASVRLAAEAGGGLIATEPSAELVESFQAQAPEHRPKIGQLGMAIDDDEARARKLAREKFRFFAPGWKVMSELPNPINFEAATAAVTDDDAAELVTCGPDPEPHVEAVRQWTDAGFDHVAIVPVGDTERFFDAWEHELRPRLEERSTTGVTG